VSYCENSDIAPLVADDARGNKGPTEQQGDAIRRVGSMSLGVMPYAVDPESASRLWILSEQLLDL
jgi:hypothetical protein